MFLTKLIVLFSIFFITTSNAQEKIVPIGSLPFPISSTEKYKSIYYKDFENKLDKYFGTWVYDNGIDYFKITFSKKERVKCCRGKMFHDELVSDFVYKKNSIIVCH